MRLNVLRNVCRLEHVKVYCTEYSVSPIHQSKASSYDFSLVVFVRYITQKYLQLIIIFSGEVNRKRTNWLDYGGELDSFVGSGLLSRIFFINKD